MASRCSAERRRGDRSLSLERWEVGRLVINGREKEEKGSSVERFGDEIREQLRLRSEERPCD